MNQRGERAISLVGGDVAGFGPTNLRICGARIVAIGARPAPEDLLVELRGDRVLPGLINAHDHLQLNNFPRVKYRDNHRNVREWISDIALRRDTDSSLVAANEVPRESRLWQGALKNLLAGVTTVAHHDPFYDALRSARVPVRVLAEYGWAHSLGVDGDAQVRISHRNTPAHHPWFIHAGEGVDADARAEFARLEALGCVTPNARFIHGVAFGARECARLGRAGAGLIWCPASNLYLFGRTANVSALAAQGRVAIGSDSRLSGSTDLLAELQTARNTGLVPDAEIEALVTTISARLLCLPDRGTLRVGALADLVVLPREMPLWAANRADLRCVMLGGAMACGDPALAAQLMAPEDRATVEVDGTRKVLRKDLVEVLRRDGIEEFGVQWRAQAGRAA